jgi:hypothetical protein
MHRWGWLFLRARTAKGNGASIAQGQTRITSITGHAIRRWMERISEVGFEEARQEMKTFLSSATVEGKPRSWMAEQRRRSSSTHGPERPIGFAYNHERPGVCLLVVLADSPFVLTVVNRPDAKVGARRWQEMEATRPSRRFHLEKAADDQSWSPADDEQSPTEEQSPTDLLEGQSESAAFPPDSLGARATFGRLRRISAAN